MPRRILKLLLVVCLLFAGSSVTAQNAARLRFRITLSKEVVPNRTSGRLLVLMTDSPQPQQMVRVGFVPASTWIAALEITNLAAGATIEFDPDANAYPRSFSQAKPGTYQMMALLDVNHSYAYNGEGEGDLASAVVKVENLNPADAKPIELALTRTLPGRPKPADTETTELVEFQSPALTAFWGRPMTMRAGVVLPPSYGQDTKKRYATVYHIHGFGGDHTGAWRQGTQLVKEMSEGRQAEMIHVFLDGSFPTGHHEFADSANNGPWGRALTE